MTSFNHFIELIWWFCAAADAHSSPSECSMLEICHHDIEKIVFPFLQNNGFGNMIRPLLTTSSSSFGGFVQQQAPTADLQNAACWKYAIMISKKLFLYFCKIMLLVTRFDYFKPRCRAHLVVFSSSRRHRSPSECSMLEMCHHEIKKIVFSILQNNCFGDMI